MSGYDDNNPFADDNEQLPQVYNPFEATEPPNYPVNDDNNNNDDDDNNNNNVVDKKKENKKKENKKKKKKKKKTETAYAAGLNNNDDVWGGSNDHKTSLLGDSMSNDGPVTESDVIIREQNAKRREAEIIEREKKLNEMDKIARKQGLKPYNWPFKCWAIAYHSIDDDILPVFQSLVKKMYYILLATWLTLFWNMVVVFGRWFTKDVGGDGTQAIWSLVYVLIGSPGGWLLWYRPLYYGCIDDSTGKWGMFLFNFLMHTLFCIVMAIGIPSTAAAGLMYMIDLFVNYSAGGLGFIALVATLLWIIIAVISTYMLKRAHVEWRMSGKQAQLEKDMEKADAAKKLLY